MTNERSGRAARAVRVVIVALVAIGLAAVARRAYVLVRPPSSPPPFPGAEALDAGFAAHALLTWLHILPGALLFALMPLQFSGRLRERRPAWHRRIGRAVLALGLVVGSTALAMSYATPIGGATESAATTLFALLFLGFLGLGLREIRRGRVARHREWMTRAFGVALGIATTRPIVGAFFAARRLTPHEFFGPAFWLGFSVTLLAAEAWVRASRLPDPAA